MNTTLLKQIKVEVIPRANMVRSSRLDVKLNKNTLSRLLSSEAFEYAAHRQYPVQFIQMWYDSESEITNGKPTTRCKTLFPHPQPKPSTSTSSSSSRPNGTGTSTGSGPGRSGGGRGIGSDKNPIDMAYYDVLGLDSQCTTEEIKKAYRRLAIKVSILLVVYYGIRI